jgi:glycosyltransferase involved in cell wall biosynthesis
MGVDVKLRTTEMPIMKRYQRSLQERYLKMVFKKYRPAHERIRLIHRDPMHFVREDDRLTLGMTYSETTEIPQEWVDRINGQVDALIVASADSATVFRQAGVGIPLWIIPQGVNIAMFYPFKGSKRLLPSKLPAFRFLSVFEWAPRKGYDVLLRAYWEEFERSENVCLIIKTRSFKRVGDLDVRTQIQRLKERLGRETAAPVYVYDGRLSETALAELYRASSAFVLPTRGEGIGLPFLEAGATGLPVIATGWGGQMDFLSAENAFLVDYRKTSVAPELRVNWGSLAGEWAEPDVASLRRQMRWVYENYAEALNIAGRLRAKVMQERSWRTCTRQFVRRIEEETGMSMT